MPDIFTELLMALGLLREKRPGLADAAPIALSTFVGADASDFILRIEDAEGNLVSELRATEAASSADGYLSFTLRPANLPEVIVLRQSSPFGFSFIAGPCDPIELSRALEHDDLDSLDRFLQETLPPVPNPASETPLIPSDENYPA